jgi:hypothetical protein
MAGGVTYEQGLASGVQTGQMTTPFDYDRNPERFRLAARVTRQHLTMARSLYDHLAEVLVGVRARRILDIGCGEGGIDSAWTALQQQIDQACG